MAAEGLSLPLVLGSSSKWRRQVLEQHFGEGIVRAQIAPDIDEAALRDPDPCALASAIARAKADAVVPRAASRMEPESAVVVCSDQVVSCKGQIRSKPESEAEARQFLQSYGPDSPAETHTALVVARVPGGPQASAVHTAKVIWKSQIDAAVIDRLVAKGQVMTTAGGFVAEDPELAPFIDRIEGGLDSVQGMPLDLLKELWRRVESGEA
eukprot:TRINITY_DN19078_c0_g1_i1.p2 TRINITY_DN19078_c0_g1~~TRINITY_DN19078_c0_g1_i1.p2  ORF type:complete len:228 (+),score=59.25 TRINITY_DN19078_c0_g1_i1:55-684(+)